MDRRGGLVTDLPPLKKPEVAKAHKLSMRCASKKTIFLLADCLPLVFGGLEASQTRTNGLYSRAASGQSFCLTSKGIAAFEGPE